MTKHWFWFTIGCHVLYSYLYEDETLEISHSLVIDLEERLGRDARDFPELVENLRVEFPELYSGLIDRFVYFSQNNLPIP